MKYYSDYFNNNTSNYTLKIEHYNKNIAYIYENDEIIYKITSLENLNRCFDNNIVQIEKVDNIIKQLNDDDEEFYNEFDSDDDISIVKEDIEYLNVKIVNNLSMNDNKTIQLNGVLMINTLKNYGINKRGIPYYKFKPLDKKYPTFLVACSAKKKSKEKNIHNLYCKIKFKDWDITSKYPYGILEDTYGEIDDYDALCRIIQSKYNIIPNRKISIKEEDLIYEKDLILKENRYKYGTIYVNNNIFSIDPEGCRDIDDAFHCNYDKKEQHYKVYIHIADVSDYIMKDSNIENNCKNTYQTIYNSYAKNVEMLPELLSTQICSLKETNLTNLALTVRIAYDKDLNIIETTVYETLIKCNYNLTYNQAQNILDKKLNNQAIKEQLEILKKISKEDDSHKLVAYFMVLANNKISEFILKNRGITINRVYKQLNIQSLQDATLSTFLNYYNNDCAKYIVNTLKETNEIINHDILGLSSYTHYTSPIRRYIDIEVHRIVKDILNEDNNINIEYYKELCNNINQRNKDIKKYYRELDKLNLVYHNEIKTTYSGYIININNENLNIYIDELKIIYNYNILSKNKDKIIHIDLLEDNSVIIRNTLSLKEKQIKLYDKVQLQLFINKNKNDINKIDIKIINPNIEELYY